MPGPIYTRHASDTVDELIGSAYPIVKKVAQNIAHVRRVSEHVLEIDGVFEAVQHIYGVYNNIEIITALSVNINGIIGITEHFDEIMQIYNDLDDIYNAVAASSAAVLLARNWANADFATEIELGMYSAKHWSIASQNSADAASLAASVSSGHAVAASASATASQVARVASEAARDAAIIAETAAELAETNAEAAQAAAETARNQAQTAETAAELAETNAEAAQAAAEAARDAAQSSEDDAEAAQAAAADSASAAAGSAATATTQADIATTKAGEALASAVAADASADAADVSETNAAASAAAALVSENNAETAETNAEAAQAAAEVARDAAQTAETNAETAETNAETAQGLAEAARDAAITAKNAAETAENNAETAETNAEAAKTAAEAAQAAAEAAQSVVAASAAAADASADAAALSETAAETAATNAAASETAAETAETNAEAAAVAAAASEVAAELAETNAETAETNAETAAANSIAALVDFNTKYLMAQATDPALDNNGNALSDGSFYWNTTLKALRFYDLGTTTWTTGAGGGGGGGTADTVVYDPAASGLTATTVQDALDEIDTDLDAVQADITAIETKTDFISVTQAVNLDTLESDVAASKAKTDWITVTQAVDLDAIEIRVNALDAAVWLAGSWDASAGTFPGGGTAQAGASYIVSVAGTVDGVAFNINDRVIAITDNASTATFAANWFKADYTDQVLSVAGLTGAISDTDLKTALGWAAAFAAKLDLTGGTLSGPLTIGSTSGSDPFIITTRGASGSHGAIIQQRSINNAGADSAVQFNDTLGGLNVRGYGITGFSSVGRGAFSFKAAENWTDAAQGTRFALELTPLGSITRAEVFTIENDGLIKNNGLNLSPLIRQNSKSAAYTITLNDLGGHIYHPAADTTARVWTIDSNANMPAPIGSTITFDNDFGAGVITIAITSDTLVLVGTAGSTGSRTLASGGQATAVKVTSTRWRISGVGLT